MSEKRCSSDWTSCFACGIIVAPDISRVCRLAGLASLASTYGNITLFKMSLSILQKRASWRIKSTTTQNLLVLTPADQKSIAPAEPFFSFEVIQQCGFSLSWRCFAKPITKELRSWITSARNVVNLVRTLKTHVIMWWETAWGRGRGSSWFHSLLKVVSNETLGLYSFSLLARSMSQR